LNKYEEKENLDLVEDQFIHSLTNFSQYLSCVLFFNFYFKNVQNICSFLTFGFFSHAEVFEKQSRSDSLSFPNLESVRQCAFFMFWATTRNIWGHLCKTRF